MNDCRNRFVYRAKADEGPLFLDPALSNASNNIRTAIHQLFDAHGSAAKADIRRISSGPARGGDTTSSSNAVENVKRPLSVAHSSPNMRGPVQNGALQEALQLGQPTRLAISKSLHQPVFPDSGGSRPRSEARVLMDSAADANGIFPSAFMPLAQDANLLLDGQASFSRSLMDTASDYEMEAGGPELSMDAACKLLAEQAFASGNETVRLTAGKSAEAEDSRPELPSAESQYSTSDGQTTMGTKKLVLETSLVVAVACPFAVARKGVFHLEQLAHILLLKGLQSQGPEKNVSTLQSITHLHRLLAFGEDVVIKTAGSVCGVAVGLLEAAQARRLTRATKANATQHHQ